MELELTAEICEWLHDTARGRVESSTAIFRLANADQVLVF